MITTLISWIIIFYTLFSLGDCFINLYNKICRNNEKYNLLDTFLLGICVICILLPISSFWLPSNHIILFTYIIIGTIHWIFNFTRLKNHINSIKQFLLSTNITQKIFILIPILSILVYVYIFDHHYDAEYYQYQNIRWNEEYAIIPGLGNFEDRFGFNSNYLLVSAIFTFRFLFGTTEAIYSLQSLTYICILCWITISFIKDGYNIFHIILLAISYLIIPLMGYSLASSSTDIMPLLFIFYYISKSTINIKWLKAQPLLALLLPITLITFKLSTAVFCLVCLSPFIFLIKKKKYKELSFILSSGFLIVVLWCIRNIIISGYLVYPLYNLDFFNYDWKIPNGTAFIQKIYINNFAERIFFYDLLKAQKFINGNIDKNTIISFFNIIFYSIILISPAIIIYKKKRLKIDKARLYIYLFILFCIIFNFATAPDLRFSYGYILGLFSFLAFIFSKSTKYAKTSKTKVILSSIVLCLFICSATYKFINAGKRIGMKFENIIDFASLYHHRNAKNLNTFEEYQMGEYTVYTTKERSDNRTFDILLATDPNGIPFENFSGLKIQDIRTIELRGKKLQEGFRTKPEYIDIINNNAEKYKSEYYKSLKARERNNLIK